MSPTIILGDIHGLTYWKEVIKDNPGCKYVFLGDYLDPYERMDNQALINNLKEIIRLKEEQPDHVILLLGNHDMHYFPSEIGQSSRFNFRIAEKAYWLFMENLPLFQYAYQEGNCIFTHAGIVHEWFTDDFKGDLHQNIADQLNHPLPEQIPALCRCGSARGGNRGAIGGIFWADISELYKPLQGYTQIVGHNRVDDITDQSIHGGRIIFCDCLFNKHYLKI
jgi:hypothetical protein